MIGATRRSSPPPNTARDTRRNERATAAGVAITARMRYERDRPGRAAPGASRGDASRSPARLRANPAAARDPVGPHHGTELPLASGGEPAGAGAAGFRGSGGAEPAHLPVLRRARRERDAALPPGGVARREDS